MRAWSIVAAWLVLVGGASTAHAQDVAVGARAGVSYAKIQFIINNNPREDDTTIKHRVFAVMMGVRFSCSCWLGSSSSLA